MSVPVQRAGAAGRLAALQADFDESFTRPAALQQQRHEVLLRVRAGGVALAVPLSRLAGLQRLPRVVALPGAPPGLLGVAGLRGQLVAVHSLAARLGLAPEEAPRWLLLCGGARRVGLAAGDFEGQLRVAPEQVRPDACAAHTTPLLSSSVLEPGAPPLPLLDVDSLVELLLDGAQAPRLSR